MDQVLVARPDALADRQPQHPGTGILRGCGDAPYEPTPERLLGEFTGIGGTGFGQYGFTLTVDQVSDSVRGSWYLGFTASCASHGGPFSGVLQGDQLQLQLRPDEFTEVTLAMALRVLPGDTVLAGRLTLVSRGRIPQDRPVFCTSDELAPVRLHASEVAGASVVR